MDDGRCIIDGGGGGMVAAVVVVVVGVAVIAGVVIIVGVDIVDDDDNDDDNDVYGDMEWCMDDDDVTSVGCAGVPVRMFVCRSSRIPPFYSSPPHITSYHTHLRVNKWKR